MRNPDVEDEDDKPLSPEGEAIMAKARRRAAISMLIMLIGFMAIAGVVVYRLATLNVDPAAEFALETVSVPAGAEVVSSAVQDGLVTVTYVLDGTTTIRLFDGETGDIVREIAVEHE
ncbi:DUF6476 family protein [Pelagibacterium xiamenense]|uniref:DUF6476 family protein n=1 Tax=Pelagibacterium xiamenense TaxID=2901140 RepID=UPI001E4F1A20|nr:DUF6476 family protein [Pelagibacterium xiamenense]MCD7060422.1 DUF6476 family protein [Pelagibacterium xiamenense]